MQEIVLDRVLINYNSAPHHYQQPTKLEPVGIHTIENHNGRNYVDERVRRKDYEIPSYCVC